MTSTSPPAPQPALPPPAAPPPAATPLPVASPRSTTPPPAAPSPVATAPTAAAPRPTKTPPSAPPSSPPASSPPTSPESSPPPVPKSSPPPAVPSPSPPEPKTPPSPPSKPETPVARSPPAPSGRRLSPPAPPSESKSNGVSIAVVVAVVAGAVAAVLLVLIVAFLCCRKRRRRDGGVPPPGGYYYRGRENYYGEEWNHQAPLPPDTNIKLQPHFPHPPAYASRPPLPPPPPPVFSSSGGSASNNSGSENPLPSPSTGMTLGFAKSAFSFEELTLATDGFSNANLLGQGGFGYVHRGVLPNGKEVAVKQLKTGSGQGEREFQAEVEIISRVHHKHLVSLVGYCITGDRRLLVYEFVPNNTLEFHLHGKGRPTMEWPTRLKIAIGAAKGLAYLHEDCHPKIIHRDIKAANILLDYKFETKVSDFGLAKFTSDDNTHVSTRVMGTFGYLAPEYATSGKLSDKSDVFSFGVMLLELITGRRPVDTTNTLMDDSLVDWVRPLLTRALEDGNYDTIADPRLQKKFNANEMARAIACAAACVRHSARRRPRMTQVVRALEGDSSLDDLNEGVLPGHSSNYGSYGGSDYDSGQYMEDMKKFRKVVLASQEHASSGYSAATSEYGLNPSASSSEAVTREMDISKTRQESGGLR